MTPEELTIIRDMVVSLAHLSPWHTPEEASAYCRCSDETLRRAVNAGLLKKHYASGMKSVVRFHKDDLDRWLMGRK